MKHIPIIDTIKIPINLFTFSPDRLTFFGISDRGILSYFDHVCDNIGSSKLHLIRNFDLS